MKELQILENAIRESSADGDANLKTEQAAIWIQDLISSGPHPTPEANDHRLGDTGVVTFGLGVC